MSVVVDCPVLVVTLAPTAGVAAPAAQVPLALWQKTTLPEIDPVVGTGEGEGDGGGG